jgi:hypothetical protein
MALCLDSIDKISEVHTLYARNRRGARCCRIKYHILMHSMKDTSFSHYMSCSDCGSGGAEVEHAGQPLNASGKARSRTPATRRTSSRSTILSGPG